MKNITKHLLLLLILMLISDLVVFLMFLFVTCGY